MKNTISLTVEQKGDGLTGLMRALESLSATQVLVGVPADKTQRRDGDKINNAEIAMIQDKGSPARNIPARPFLGAGIEEGKAAIQAQLKRTAKAAFEGKPSAVAAGFEAVGLTAQAAVQRKITAGPFKALSAATIMARRYRSAAGDEQPLIDTGQLRQSISYVIRKKKKGK